MKTILLPTDFSDNSWNAIKYALQLYKDESCTFILHNIYTPIVYDVEYVLVAPAQLGLLEAIRDESKRRLNELYSQICNEIEANPKHKFEMISRFNTLISGIKEVIIERDIDLVIMGTKGATGANEILFGSNTVHVFKNAHCPILAIPADFEYESPQEILFPTDLKVNYLNVPIKILSELAALHQSRINVLHVSSGSDLTELQKAKQLQLEVLFAETAYLFHDMESMDISEAIDQFQGKHRINLLAMVNNKHSMFETIFIKNTVNQLGFHLNVPFLVIPPESLKSTEI